MNDLDKRKYSKKFWHPTEMAKAGPGMNTKWRDHPYYLGNILCMHL